MAAIQYSIEYTLLDILNSKADRINCSLLLSMVAIVTNYNQKGWRQH